MALGTAAEARDGIEAIAYLFRERRFSDVLCNWLADALDAIGRGKACRGPWQPALVSLIWRTVGTIRHRFLGAFDVGTLPVTNSTAQPSRDIPPDLLELPDRVVEVPPVETRIGELPFEHLSWQNFERLLFRLARSDADVEYCARYGRSGQAQEGIDIYGRLSNSRYVCWQAKNSRATPTRIRNAVTKFLDGSWAERSERFVLCVRGSLADTKLQDAIEQQARRLIDHEVSFHAYDGFQLSDMLRRQPEIINDFFGRQWLLAFEGPSAAESVPRRLDGAKVVTLRKRLATIYDFRFRQLDPGLALDNVSTGPSDIRKRFVSPHVDLSSPFAEPALESGSDVTKPNEEPADRFADDDDDHAGRNARALDGRPNDLIESPRLRLEDWLAQGPRSILLGGAGSGKSTVLRCLALDALRAPMAFPGATAQFGQRIPLLIPFALWCRLTERCEREVGLPEVLRATFGAFVPEDELQTLFLEALIDERLFLLIDGLDEYGNEQAARLALATIESFVQTQNISAIMTARPAGLRRLGVITGDWQIARLAELSRPQQRELAIRLLTEHGEPTTPVTLRVDQFFEQIERTGRLQSLAANPLLLHGLLSVAARQAILPRTRYQLFERLVEILLDIHPNRRAIAASEVQARTRAFAADDLRREALARLAFEMQRQGADAGIDRNEARSILEAFLQDNAGAGWSRDSARQGAAELTSVDADTSGLLVERSPQEIAFCHAAFREHLAGLELARWTLERQKAFTAAHADNPRWRAAIVSLLQSLRRQADVEELLQGVQGASILEQSADRTLLLADGVFAAASLSGRTGLQVARAALNRVEESTDDNERIELLGLALDGPRAGPIGEEITQRLARWWPGSASWRSDIYEALAAWRDRTEISRPMILGLHDDTPTNRMAAAAALARAFGGDDVIGRQLVSLAQSSRNGAVTAAALDALSRGWPDTNRLDEWLHDGVRSVSVPLRTVALLARYRRGWRGNHARDALLDALDENRSGFRGTYSQEIATALVTDWAGDEQVHDTCWASVSHRRSPNRGKLDIDTALSILLRLHRHDPRVAQWLCEEFKKDGPDPFLWHQSFPLLQPVVTENSDVRAAVETWFAAKKYSDHDHHVCQLAAMHRSQTSKNILLGQLERWSHFRFWPVSCLLDGWGIDDPDVAGALVPLARESPSKRDDIAQYIPTIVRDPDESSRLLLETCALPEVNRPDFVIRGFAAAGRLNDDAEVVTAVLPHVPARQGVDTGVSALIEHFPCDPRVKQFTLRRLRERWPPLATIAKAYAHDREVRNAVLLLASPLPTFLRRNLARRAAQRFDDDALNEILQKCDLECDSHAKVQATIGLARSALAKQTETDACVRRFAEQLNVIGPDMDERRVAAFAGLLALGRNDVFVSALDREKPLTIRIAYSHKDYEPVLELIADRWDHLEQTMGASVARFSRWEGDPYGVWKVLAPYVNRSPGLAGHFLEYCSTSDAQMDAGLLATLCRLKPKSPLLLAACLKTLADDDSRARRNLGYLDLERARVLASKCVCADFISDSTAQEALLRATENHTGTAFVGLAATWPDHERVVRKMEQLQVGDPRSERMVWCAYLWVVAARGDAGLFTRAASRFITRPAVTWWDFASDSLAAIRSRLERDAEARALIAAMARGVDDPSIQASVPRLLASTQAGREEGVSLAGELLRKEQGRDGLPRFALDVMSNRVRRISDALHDVVAI